jgi:hypothetical protein
MKATLRRSGEKAGMVSSDGVSVSLVTLPVFRSALNRSNCESTLPLKRISAALAANGSMTNSNAAKVNFLYITPPAPFYWEKYTMPTTDKSAVKIEVGFFHIL